MDVRIPAELAQNLLAYLAGRPIAEALPLFSALGQLVKAQLPTQVVKTDIPVPDGKPEKKGKEKK